MSRLLLALTCVFTLICNAQDGKAGKSAASSDLAAALDFEAPRNGDMPGGWGGGPPGTLFADDSVVHSGHWSARLERNPTSANSFSTITKSIPIDFSGATIELRGFLRTEEVTSFAGLWMREDGESGPLAFDNMQKQHLNGTTAWTEYSISLPLHPDATQLVFGVLLVGTGKAWADGLQLLVDGKPVWDAPKIQHPIERPKTALDTDHEFDGGSGIAIHSLTALQVDNLATLGKVWGFLKYHHPAITSGGRHWDYDLLRVLPAILAAGDRTAANAALGQWIDKLGAIASCKPCATLDDADLAFKPDLDWIANQSLLGGDLSKTLRSIEDNRAPGQQFYLSLDSDVRNPKFAHEPGYESLKFPDPGFQLLSLYRFWNIIEYWSPYRDILGENWDGVLAAFIPRIALAQTPEAYQLQMLALINKAHDGHANLWHSLGVRPPVGQCMIPADVRFIENLPVISGLAAKDPAPELKVGDVITELDGVPVGKLIEDWLPYYAGSNLVTRMRDVGRYMTRGKCGNASIAILRDRQPLKLTVQRVPLTPNDLSPGAHDLPGPTFRLLSKDVAYLKLSSVKAVEVPKYLEQAAETKGLIIDIRNYPSEFMVFALGSHLVDSETAFVRFTEGDLSNPGAFHWTKPFSLNPETPHYQGKIVILVDETSMSQSEYTAMAFRSARGATVVGSTTAGADGNVSPFALPGGLSLMISGIGVFYPDKAPTQRIGIIPNVEVKPTIAGIRAGRDEVLEEALPQIVGRSLPAAEIERIAKPQPQ